ncbi:MAG: HNH endonuclease [Armatimonadota bacterium]
MSITKVPEKIRMILWGQAAGRCEYEGCNERLFLDHLTKAQFNTSYIAHIVADSPDGPRGDAVLSDKLKADISNLMLMCDRHHRLIDKEDVPGHPVARLTAMKLKHEQRIDILADISEDKRSHILLYGARIGEQDSPLSYREARVAMVPDRYPAETNPISIGLVNSSIPDGADMYWAVEEAQMRTLLNQRVRPLIGGGKISHISVFALAPQPLLILLGSLLTDIPAIEVYQRRREPLTWRWDEKPESWSYDIVEPEVAEGDPALVFSLSGTVTERRITNVLGPNVSIWQVSIPNQHNDFLVSRPQASEFRVQMRALMNRIKLRHGEAASIHVFPVMPVSLAVDFGRILMPKADLPLVVYDRNQATGEFTRALNINARPS